MFGSKKRQLKKAAEEAKAVADAYGEAKTKYELTHLPVQDEEKILRQREIDEINRPIDRDADTQEEPYEYQIGQHANETLAIRYGIANYVNRKAAYENIDDNVPSSSIRLRKLGKDPDPKNTHLYIVELTDFRGKKARAWIEPGNEYVHTFYPANDSWFQRHGDLDETLKVGNTFTLKELAALHIEMMLSNTQGFSLRSKSDKSSE